MADKIDPYDVAALERSLNDSATRVSTIWISFLIFSLYLLTAATTVTHRQLFLAEPVKLPVLNIDLPLWGFFFLAPILFVIFHAYVLLQVLLLGRTAAAYNEAMDRAVKPPSANATMRQRLANTLFAQIFAGSPRERDGWLGWLLKAMAWITLAIAPILILLAFQFAFLPYHSHLATWTHRLLIAIELAAVFILWPLVMDASRDFRWLRISRQFKHVAAVLCRLLRSQKRQRYRWLWLRQQGVPLVSCLFTGFVSLSLATFPGEPHVNLLTMQPLSSVQCDRWISSKFDRLELPRLTVDDDEKLATSAAAPIVKSSSSLSAKTVRNFRERNFACADLTSARLGHVDLTRTNMSGALLISAVLQNSLLVSANLRGASLQSARLQAAELIGSQLQGANLDRAKLQGASLLGSGLAGASLEFADLRGSQLDYAQFQGASLRMANFQGATLEITQFQGADLDNTDFQGALFKSAELQGATLIFAKLTYAILERPHVWRAYTTSCEGAKVSNFDFRPTLLDQVSVTTDPNGFGSFSIITPNDRIPATPAEIIKFIERTTARACVQLSRIIAQAS